MKKQIRIFQLNETELCNDFLQTLHSNDVIDIKIFVSHSTMYGRIVVIYLTN